MIELRAFEFHCSSSRVTLQDSERDPARNGRIRRTVLDAWREGRAAFEKRLGCRQQRTRRVRARTVAIKSTVGVTSSIRGQHKALKLPAHHPLPTPDFGPRGQRWRSRR